MKGLDTNILVRYVTQDDFAQWQLASDYLEATALNNQACLINNIVLCELVWVLRSVYRFSKSQIVQSLTKIASTDLFYFENQQAVLLAIQQFKTGSADFSDYLIGQTNQHSGCEETATFDQKLANTAHFNLLTSVDDPDT